MGDILQSGWAIEGLNVFVGAFLGAFLGFAFDRHQSTQEQKNKQAALLAHLHRELSLLGEEALPGDRHALSLRVPIRVNVIPRLLDGDLLGYREHGTLLDHLILLEQMISKYNDWAVLTNESQTLGRRSPDEVAQMQHAAGQIATIIATLRSTTLSLLGVSEADVQRILAILEHAVNDSRPSATRR
jgi:hypothetical protein